MDILKTLRFVRGAVSTKSFIPEMKHFVVKDGTVRAFNGIIAISSPIDFDVNCAPIAEPFIKAIDICEDVVSLGMTGANRLRIQSGKFRAYINCVELEAMADQQPVGDEVGVDGGTLLDAITTLLPFVGNDASKPWSNGILLRDQSAYATNNVCLVEYWLGVKLPFTVNVPVNALKEVVRIKEPPTHLQINEQSITFHYNDGRWIRSQLYATNWPDQMCDLLGAESNQKEIPDDFFQSLATLKPFLDEGNRVYFIDGKLRTSDEEEIGAMAIVEDLPPEGIYNHHMLSLLAPVAKTADFATYPRPVIFYGGRLRGAIIGYSQ